jgi:hypothetical protein
VTPDEARRAAGSAASSVESGKIGIADLSGRFNGVVGNRSSDEPRSGDYLRLSQALEAWKVAVGDRGVVAEARYGWLCSWNPTTVPNGLLRLGARDIQPVWTCLFGRVRHHQQPITPPSRCQMTVTTTGERPKYRMAVSPLTCSGRTRGAAVQVSPHSNLVRRHNFQPFGRSVTRNSPVAVVGAVRGLIREVRVYHGALETSVSTRGVHRTVACSSRGRHRTGAKQPRRVAGLFRPPPESASVRRKLILAMARAPVAFSGP